MGLGKRKYWLEAMSSQDQGIYTTNIIVSVIIKDLNTKGKIRENQLLRYSSTGIEQA